MGLVEGVNTRDTAPYHITECTEGLGFPDISNVVQMGVQVSSNVIILNCGY